MCRSTYLLLQLRDLSHQVANHHLNFRRLVAQLFLHEIGRHATVLTQNVCSSPDRFLAVVRLGGAPPRERLPDIPTADEPSAKLPNAESLHSEAFHERDPWVAIAGCPGVIA